MDYITEIFNRLDIQHIREFLLHGTEECVITQKSYKERIDMAKKDAINMLQEKFQDMDEYEKITDYIYDYTRAVEEVYMEIGLQCGFVLSTQITANTKASPRPNMEGQPYKYS